MTEKGSRAMLVGGCSLFILFLGALFLPPLRVQGLQQKRGKLITRELPRPSDPVEITDLKLGLNEAPVNKPMELDDEWLKDLSFKLKNTSTKNIVYAVVELSFPDSKATGNMLVYDFRFGRHPGGEVNPTRGPLLLEPGKAIQVSLGERYAGIKKYLESRQAIATYNTLMIRPYVVFFEDGTQWSLGSYYRPDPERHGRYIKIEDPPNIILKN